MINVTICTQLYGHGHIVYMCGGSAIFVILVDLLLHLLASATSEL